MPGCGPTARRWLASAVPWPTSKGADAAGNFRTAMADALANVSRDQFAAQRLQKEFSMDNPTVSLEQTMVAMQKSQIGFQAAVQVRNRLLSAYTDIMNMHAGLTCKSLSSRAGAAACLRACTRRGGPSH